MVILCDTRQKKGKHDKKHEQMIQLGAELKHIALETGDYMLDGNDTITIDTKQNLDEVAGNIFNDNGRFMREVRRAYNKHMKFIVLIEHGGQIKSIKDVSKWHSKYSAVSGRSLQDRMYRIHMAYGTEFLFCDKRVTGRKIIELLSEVNNGEVSKTVSKKV